MLDAAIQAVGYMFRPDVFVMLLAGIGIGITIGILPGLGGIVGMSILLPFVWTLKPEAALALLIGMIGVLRTSDTIPAVLFAVPGTAGAQATIVDGYPLAQKGQAGRALGASFLASMIGGLIGALFLILSLPVARPIVRMMTSAQFFMLCVWGIAMVGVLAGTQPIKGVVAGLLGLLLASMGGAPSIYEFRYTFGLPYLEDGISLVTVALAFFAMPEIADLVIRGTTIATIPDKLGKGIRDGMKDTLRNWWLVLRVSVIGTFIGFIPGLGAATANWIAYGHALQCAKDKSQFSKGDIRGVIAPEAANNAADGGAIIPTLIFGIPGSGSMAIFLFALMVMGVTPGQTILTTQLPLAFVCIWSFAMANVIAAGLCIFLARPFAALTRVKVHSWVPVALMLIILGAFQSSRSWGDLFILLILGLLGWFMKRAGWPRPPIIIGFVLGRLAEKYFWISTARYGASWLWQPGVIILAIIIVISVLAGLRMKPAGGMAAEAEVEKP
ncbi:MAG: tripartite tricarboxylate transporter permease [Thermodesulfobacteriota bacterium]|nr:tripartite tricarboxylate transporter permease [Thermodesulfobacteriota bacterium]